MPITDLLHYSLKEVVAEAELLQVGQEVAESMTAVCPKMKVESVVLAASAAPWPYLLAGGPTSRIRLG